MIDPPEGVDGTAQETVIVTEQTETGNFVARVHDGVGPWASGENRTEAIRNLAERMFTADPPPRLNGFYEKNAAPGSEPESGERE